MTSSSPTLTSTAGAVTPHAARRARLMERIGHDAALILVNPEPKQRSHDTSHSYRAHSDFYYLTGFTEAESILVLTPGHDEGDFHLFVPPKDPLKEQWDGVRLGPVGAELELGADKGHTLDEFSARLPQLLAHRKALYHLPGTQKRADHTVKKTLHAMRTTRNKFAYAPDLGIDKVVIYKLNPATAAMEKIGFADTRAGAGPRHMKFGKDGRQAYVLTELHLTVTVYDRDPATGLLGKSKQDVRSLAEGIDPDGMSCSEIRVHPNGKFLYAANRDGKRAGRDSISVFQVLEEGRLKRIQSIPAKVSIPRNIGVDPDGKWLLVAGQRSGNVPVFRIRKDGTLQDNGNEVKVANAMCVEFLKKGN